jgi:thiol-disulfide isomerase/thioredoxin
MRNFIFATLAVLFAVGAAQAKSPQGVEFFEGTLAAALEKAGKEKKQVFVYFHTEWCRPCKAFAQSVLPTKKAGKYFNARFVNMSLDAEKGEGIEIAKEFDVELFPTFMVFEPDRTLVTKFNDGSDEVRTNTAKFIEFIESKIASGATDDPALEMMREMLRRSKDAPILEITDEMLEEARLRREQDSVARAAAKQQTKAKTDTETIAE